MRRSGVQWWLAADTGEQSETEHAYIRDALESIAVRLAGDRGTYRAETLEATAHGECSPSEAMQRLDAMYRVERLGYHAWRGVHHLGRIPDPLADVPADRGS
jgi:hypothetical protein